MGQAGRRLRFTAWAMGSADLILLVGAAVLLRIGSRWPSRMSRVVIHPVWLPGTTW